MSRSSLSSSRYVLYTTNYVVGSPPFPTCLLADVGRANPKLLPATPAITPIHTVMLASANTTTIHIARRLPTESQVNISTRAAPSHTADEGEYFDLNVSGDKDKDRAAPSLLQTATDTTWTDPYAMGG
ncbi:uncharacterized protein HD556DRAFT_1441431 [Suillus plorans]|uniref:Uncharacterized protein n=1 Tax=Suillus plorans TaxID=116603 RepID=A0A9P7AU50_9AGAM|nr:uncharacterized protein HD556DRAFT_1441431 [Suillus plorans]KAG1796736.1 hypothetical protein HD556DRAFT_1441431 [Suillus plorans]